MKWWSKKFSHIAPKKQLTNWNSGKSFKGKYDEMGGFQYDNEGFTLSYDDFLIQLKWADITQLNVYKVDQMTVDRIDMEIVYGEKVFSISEDLPGWYQFVIKTKEVFPMIPKDCDLTIIHPAFATNYRTIYDRSDV